MPRPTLRRYLIVLAFLAAAVVSLSGMAWMVGGADLMSVVGGALLLGALLLIFIWVAWKVIRRLLWRVRRRLAFSYFLIGVLPIPMVALLILLNAYLLAGYFLGHLFRDAEGAIRADLQAAADLQLSDFSTGTPQSGDTLFGYYRSGVRVAGDDRLPESWPGWMELPGTVAAQGDFDLTEAPYVSMAGDTPTLAAVSRQGGEGVLALFGGDLEAELRNRSDVWVQLYRPDDPRRDSGIRIRFAGRDYALQRLELKKQAEGRSDYFGTASDLPVLDRPYLWWGEISGPLLSLAEGSVVGEFVTASLNGTPRTVTRHLFSGSAEVNTEVWAGLLSATLLLSSLYLLAVTMALVIIFTLSRAVDRLSRATDRVQTGDFGVRIPVRRRDQVGELQRSFNQMAANLETLVATAAQKESLEKELELARGLQRSLLPADVPRFARLDFATLFEPSAAIGGDYFDILPMNERQVTVVIADVVGHGLPAGLRMAMLKAALLMLVEENRRPEHIVQRLSTMVRRSAEERYFVTATVATVDVQAGVMELTNAGHPPTYLLRDGEVREILLPGHPLGVLGTSYGQEVVRLAPHDVVIWLSDGLIEACDTNGEPFGYDRVKEALAGSGATAGLVRDRLLASVARYADGRPPEDDRTLVAMRYHGGDAAG
jgi:serine phosphatase RsbU (regulator of sigma subunit)